MGDQEFDIVKSIDCMTKYSEMVIDPLRIRYCLEKAIYLAYSGRPGPAWLDIPLDVQGAYVDTEQLVGFDAFEVKARAERVGRNPQTKETITIPASKTPVFKAGKALKDAVSK